MLFYIQVSQLIISIFFIALVLLQQRGGGLGSLAGGQAQFYSSRRGFEKIIFSLTVILGAIFIILSIVPFLIN